jgi:Ca2+-binding EF-hand superfamily protein
MIRTKLRAASYSVGGVDWEKLFRHYDRDNSGELDFNEFSNAIRKVSTCSSFPAMSRQ